MNGYQIMYNTYRRQNPFFASLLTFLHTSLLTGEQEKHMNTFWFKAFQGTNEIGVNFERHIDPDKKKSAQWPIYIQSLQQNTAFIYIRLPGSAFCEIDGFRITSG